MAEMKTCGYNTLDDEWDISTYLEKYRPRWKGKPEAAKDSTSKVNAKTTKAAKHKVKKVSGS
jgi:hypothetical protein